MTAGPGGERPDSARSYADPKPAELLQRLLAVTTTLSRARSVEQVADVVLTLGVRNPGADTGVVWLLNEAGTHLDLAATTGMLPELKSRFASLPMDAPLPGPHVVLTGKPIYYSSSAERDENWPVLKGTQTPSQAIAVLPMTVDERTIGCLVLGWPVERQFGEAKRQFLMALAEQCAQALDRARLAEVQQRLAARMEFLAEASAALSGSLDLELVLSRITELALGVLGTMCAVDLVDEDGRTRRVGMSQSEPQSPEVLRLLSRAPIQPDTPAYRVLEAGRPVVMEQIGEDIDELTNDPGAYDLVRRLGIGPSMVIPLRARERPLGLLSVARPRDAEPFSADDISLAEELARRAAAAIDNAQLYAGRAAITRDLQAGLLPPQLPAIPHVDVAARYRAAFAGLDVGGDFYDVFPVGDRWAVMVGDVVGTGARAAATTAVVRHTARAVARRVDDPVEVVRAVGEALRDLDDDEGFCTLLYGELTAFEDHAELVLVGAGHPHPMVRRTDGTVEEIPAGGSLLGPFASEPGRSTVRLDRGDVFLAFTDGVVEARSQKGSPMFCEEGVLAVLAGETGDAAQTASAVEDAVLEFCGGEASDDIAILVLRVS